MSIEKHIGKQDISYRVRVDLGYHPVTGKRQQRMKTLPTKKEAEALQRQWLTEVERGTVVDTTKMVMRELAAAWLTMMAKRGSIAVTTLEQYRYTVAKYILPVVGQVRVQGMMVANVQLLLDDLADHPETARKTYLRLSQMLDYAQRQQWVIRNVCVDADAPSAKSKECATWTAEEARRFLDTAEASTSANRKGDNYNPLWLLALNTGMRRGELLGLRWRDVDASKSTVSVRQAVVLLKGTPYIKDVKTPASRRTIKIPADVIAALKDHRKRQTEERLASGPNWQDFDLVFATPSGKPIDPNNIQRNFTALIKRAEVPRIRVHGLRHTHATLLLKAGVHVEVVSERLGHADISITLSTYAHVLPDMQEQAVSALDVLFGS